MAQLRKASMDFEKDFAPHWFCYPAMSLVGAPSAIYLGVASAKLSEMAGIDSTMFTEQLSCFYPLPLLGEDALMEPLAKQTTNLTMLKHPLFWLYGEILKPQTIAVEAEPRLEWEPEIALRIAAQLEIARIYDPVPGAWRDVSELIGLDFNDPWVQRRVRVWQKGGADELLDNFNIGTLLLDELETNNIVQTSAQCFMDIFFLSCCSSIYSLESFLSDINELTPFEDVTSAIDIAVSIIGMDADALFLTKANADANNSNTVALEKLESDLEEQHDALVASQDVAGMLAFKDRVLELMNRALALFADEVEKMTATLEDFKEWVESDDEGDQGLDD